MSVIERASRITPDLSLLYWTAAWAGLALISVPFEALRPLVLPAAVLLSGVLAADFWLSFREPPLRIERDVPAKGSRNKSCEIVLTLHNDLARSVEVDLCETAPADLAEVEPAWRGAVVDAGGSRVFSYSIRPRVRGRRHFGVAVALFQSPLGLLRRRAELSSGQSILVQPEADRFLRPEALDPRRVLASLGVRPKRARGDGLEFDQLREYVIGDEPRRIDWRATARRGRPIVRTHRHEESRTVLLVVDTSRLMGARAPEKVHRARGPGASASAAASASADPSFASTKLDFAVDAALALAFASLAAGDRVGLVIFDAGVRSVIGPVSDRSSLGLFVDALSGLQPSLVEADYRRLTRELLTRQRKRAMVVVLTDFLEVEDEEILHPLALLSARHEVIFAALREPMLDAVDENHTSDPVAKTTTENSIYERIVLADLRREREQRLLALRRSGLSAIDVRPADATAATLNRFLELRYGAG